MHRKSKYGRSFRKKRRIVRLLPEELEEENIKETAYLRVKNNGGTFLVQYRDVVKSARNGRIFAILGIEHQSEIDYAMPFRVLRWT